MQNIYTTTTVDSSEFKKLFCGRTDDLARILDHVSRGESVALCGERRIGKTSLLYVLRDIVSGEIDTYEQELIDPELRTNVRTLKSKVPQRRAVFLSMHSLFYEQTPQGFANLVCLTLHEAALVPDCPETPSLAGIFRIVQDSLPANERLLFIVDEVEALLEFKESKQIFRNLRDIIQSFPRICFVFAGAEGWHKQIKDKTSPIVNNVKLVYLKAAALLSTELHLIRRPLCKYLAPESDVVEIASVIVGWTACKPWYVQAACYELVEMRTSDGQLPADWKDAVVRKVEESVGPTLDAFYIGENLDPLCRAILALLSNRQGLGVREIAQRLGYSNKTVWDKVSDLEALDKIRKEGAEYRIVGSLIEQWGRKTRDIPKVKSPWPQRLKWGAAALLIVLAAWLYLYTQPSSKPHSFDLGDVAVSVRMPSSLEQEESGKALVSIQNSGATTIYSVTISLNSADIDYYLDGTNRVSFDSLARNEKRFWEPNYNARSPASNSFWSQIRIAQENADVSEVYPFEISERALPIKRYLVLFSSCLGFLGGLLFKDVGQLITSVIPSLGSGSKEKKNGS